MTLAFPQYLPTTNTVLLLAIIKTRLTLTDKGTALILFVPQENFRKFAWLLSAKVDVVTNAKLRIPHFAVLGKREEISDLLFKSFAY